MQSDRADIEFADFFQMRDQIGQIVPVERTHIFETGFLEQDTGNEEILRDCFQSADDADDGMTEGEMFEEKFCPGLESVLSAGSDLLREMCGDCADTF